MTGYMFRSKLGALIFVCFIVFAVFRMVGTEGKEGDLVVATERLEAQQHGAGNTRSQPAAKAQADWQTEALAEGDWGADTQSPPY